MQEMWTGFGVLILYFVLCASTAVVLKFAVRIPPEPFRKLLHMILLGSLMVFVLAFSTWWISALAALLFAVVVYPMLALAERIKGYSQLLVERRGGEIKSSLLLVFTMFAVVIAVCWGWLGERILVLACVYAWGPGDAAAALVGKRYGEHHYAKGQLARKSVEGTAAMFLVSFAVVLLILLLRGGMSFAVCLLISVVVAAVSAVVELYTPGGLDTVTCPLADMVTLLALVHLAGGGV